MRMTTQAWWCIRGHKNKPYDRTCAGCALPRFERHAQVHASERAVVYVNPATGERKTPARADQAMPEVYRRQGFERKEIFQMTQFEHETGLVHEASNFNPGNEMQPDRDIQEFPRPKPEVIKAIAEDVAAAASSGPWTGHDKFN